MKYSNPKSRLLLAFIATVFTGVVFVFLFLFIGRNQRKYSYQDSKLLVKEISRNKAVEVESYFTNALMLARSMVQKSIILRKYNADRKQIVDLLKNTVVRSPNFLAVWTMWEPNAFDGKDDLYRGKYFYDSNGCLSVTFFHYHDTILAEKTHPDDYTKDYYTIPKRTKEELIIEPFYYQYQGYPYNFWEASVVVPVIDDSVFLGVFGIDISLDSLRNNLSKEKIFNSGYISLVSNSGIIISHKDSIFIDKNLFDILKTNSEQTRQSVQNGLEYSYEVTSEFDGKEVFRFLYPIKIGNGSNSWSVIIEIPIEEATIRSKQLSYISIVILIVGLSLIIYLVFNIFDQRRYEHNLLKAKKKAEESDKLKTAFLNNISHEIRTPLNGILGFTDLIIETNPSEKQLRNFREIIRSSSNQLLSTITNVLELSKIQTGNIEINPTNIMVDESIIIVISNFQYEAGQKGLIIKSQFPPIKQIDTLRTDEYKFQQILSNLISNAIKFTKVGEILVGYRFLLNSIEFFVQDTGVGIKSENAKKIFQFFTQEDQTLSRNFGGLGIGLSIAKSYTELLGGKITFESKPDVGTTFFFTLPISEPIESPEHRNVETSAHLLQNQSVLIVEDEKINLTLLQEIIGNANVNLFTATNGQEAIDICKKEPSISLVLMDIRMPVMNGIEATKIIKSFRKDLYIIAVTAFSQIQESSEKAEFDGVIYKPYVKDDIIATITNILNSPH